MIESILNKEYKQAQMELMDELEEDDTDEITIDYDISNMTFYEFVTQILLYSLLPAHKEWCNSLDLPYKKKLLLKPRGTYKSTIYTKCYTLYRLLKNPNMRILIISSTFENASDFMINIYQMIMSLEWFQERGINTKVSNHRILNLNIRSDFRQREPNLMAIGAFSRSLVGRHFDLIICDDVVNGEDRESQACRSKKKRWFDDIFNLLDPTGQVLVVGTRWHFDDLYGSLIKEKQWPHEVETPLNADGSYRFAPLLTEEILKEKEFELGTIHYNSQYWNNPLPEGSAIFYEKYFEKTYDKESLDQNKLTFYGYCDLALGQSKTSDYTAIITLAYDGDKYYIWDAFIERVTPDSSIEQIIALFEIYNYRRFGVESNTFQTLFKKILKEKIKERGYRYDNYITGVNVTKKKELRIETIQPYLASGKLLFPNDWKGNAYLELLIDQLLFFPVADHDDGPDALEGAVTLAKSFGASTTKVL